MNTTDERLERYLHDRSTTIDLPLAGVDTITRGARRHRRRRTAAAGGFAAAVLLGGVAAVGLSADDPGEEVGSVGAAVVDSPLEWSIVPVEDGLGWGSIAVSDGSAVYSLSTAAGADFEESMGEPRHLYRSDDGTEWEDVGLPDGLYASSVSAADGSVYAVGTAAAGGDTVGVELAVSGDGGEGWDTSAVPLDLAALADGFPGRVRPVDAEVAVGGGTTVVAVSVAGTADPAILLPDEPADTWYPTIGGLARAVSLDDCLTDPDAPAETVPPTSESEADPPPASTAPPETRPAPDAEAGRSGAAECARGDDAEPQQELRTWAELGLSPEQAAVAEGQTHVFVADADGALEPVDVFAGAAFADPSSARLLAADDGFWLVSEDRASAPPNDINAAWDVVALHSPDGRTWSPATVATAQAVLATGVVDGRPVFVTIGPGEATDEGVEQPVHVHRIEAGGSVTTVDVNQLVGIPRRAGIYAYGVGPLGVAVVLGSGNSGEDDEPVLLTSLDGLQWSRQALPEPEAGTRETVNGITVTPDAIKVRLNIRDAADLRAPEPAGQRLFVGTPAG